MRFAALTSSAGPETGLLSVGDDEVEVLPSELILLPDEESMFLILLLTLPSCGEPGFSRVVSYGVSDSSSVAPVPQEAPREPGR